MTAKRARKIAAKRGKKTKKKAGKGDGGAKAATPRRRPRRSADETRSEILDAAQRRLADGGPDALRLQDIARDVGISHPAILHHFGSREGLMQALEARVTSALTEEVGRVLLGGARGRDESSAGDLLDSVARAMHDGGLARLVAWWVLRDADTSYEGVRRIVARVVELIRVRLAEDAEAPGRRVPSREEIAFSVRLAVLAMFGDALIGDDLGQAPTRQRTAESRRFRVWMGDLLTEHLARELRDPLGPS